MCVFFSLIILVRIALWKLIFESNQKETKLFKVNTFFCVAFPFPGFVFDFAKKEKLSIQNIIYSRTFS